MSQQLQVSFQLNMPGQPFLISNMGLQASNTSTLTIGYTIQGAPTTISLTVEGLSNAQGDVSVLDTYSTVANTTRTITPLGATFDNFTVTGTWTGGTNVMVNVTFTATGIGASFSSSLDLPVIHSV
jgi:O-acetylhomoserine/O-acetylserine sulfhydrylase-like pyridoxal-dependent enzyme